MAKPKIETFPKYRPRGGRPYLGNWTSCKTMSVEWSDGTLRDYGGFARAVDCAAMEAELREIWERYRPLLRCRGPAAQFAGGGVNGYMLRVPIAAGIEALAVVRKYFAAVLGSENAEGKTRT